MYSKIRKKNLRRDFAEANSVIFCIKTELYVYLKNGNVFTKDFLSAYPAKILAKLFLKEGHKKINWLAVIQGDEIYFEYFDKNYQEILETLYYCNKGDGTINQTQKDSLSELAIKNPALFDKYLEFLGKIA